MKARISLLTAMLLIGFTSVIAGNPPEGDKTKMSARDDARLELKYPAFAIEQGMQGVVYVRCVLQENGKVKVLESNSGCGQLCSYVRESLASMRFDPEQYITGEPFDLKFTFELH